MEDMLEKCSFKNIHIILQKYFNFTSIYLQRKSLKTGL